MATSAAKKKKGLSLEEKIVLVERWITAHPQPYTMKELQQLISKQTPVIYQSVEECVLMLAAENRVQQDKIGVSTLFWKFPLTATQRANPSATSPLSCRNGTGAGPLTYAELHRRLTCGGEGGQASITAEAVKRLCATALPAQLREWLPQLQSDQTDAARCIAHEIARVGLADEEAVQAELARLHRLTTRRASLLAQRRTLSSFQSLPALVRQLTTATAIATEAANRWTDNFFLVEMEVASKSGKSQRDIREALRVPPSLDFISESSEDETSNSAEAEGTKTAVRASEKSGTTTLHAVSAKEVSSAYLAEVPSTASNLQSHTVVATPPASAVHSVTFANAVEKPSPPPPSPGNPVSLVSDTDAIVENSAMEMCKAAANICPESAAAEDTSTEAVEVSVSKPGKGKAPKPAPKKRTARKRAR